MKQVFLITEAEWEDRFTLSHTPMGVASSIEQALAVVEGDERAQEKLSNGYCFFEITPYLIDGVLEQPDEVRVITAPLENK